MSNSGGLNPTRYPVNCEADVLAILPQYLRPDDTAPVRDAIVAGLTALCRTIQEWAEYAAAQADILRATGVYEDGIGAERQVFRSGASNEDYRAAQITAPSVVTPTAILACANAILAPYTTTQAAYCESLGDRAFFFDAAQGTTPPYAPHVPLCYIYDESDTPRSPDYPDRLYASEAGQNGGFACPGREPGCARFFDDDVGRLFLLRVPDLSSATLANAPIYAELQPNAFWVGTSAAGSVTSYIPTAAVTASGLYAQIINAVTRIKGQSIRWILWVDPDLGT